MRYSAAVPGGAIVTWTDDRLAALPVRADVRLRGLEMTRLETFCDAAFAFAVTLLVISGGSIPDSYPALVAALEEVPAFLASFAAIAMIWVAHRRWSRRYGLEDGWTTLISLVMVFVTLVYVYPLRMVMSAFMSFASGGWLPARFTLTDAREMTGLFVIYGIGFALQTGMLALLYARALAVRDELGLDALERLRTRQEITMHAALATTGLASSLAAAALPTALGIWAGFVYTTLPIVMPLLARRYSRQAERLRR
jgi:uncharacterized membrane protein